PLFPTTIQASGKGLTGGRRTQFLGGFPRSPGPDPALVLRPGTRPARMGPWRLTPKRHRLLDLAAGAPAQEEEREASQSGPPGGRRPPALRRRRGLLPPASRYGAATDDGATLH